MQAAYISRPLQPAAASGHQASTASAISTKAADDKQQPGVLSKAHSSGQTGSNAAAAQDPPGAAPHPALVTMLQLHALQLPASQAEAARGRQQWVAALQLVLLTHAAAVVAAAALRYRGGVNIFSSWGQQGEAGLQGLGVGVGLVLVVLLAGESMLSLLAGSSSSSNGSGDRVGHACKGTVKRVCLRKVLVVELSAAAAVLAAIACINWALGYVTCLLLVPLAVASSPSGMGRNSTLVERVVRAAVLLCCSPVAALLLLSVVTPGVGVSGVVDQQWLQWLVHGSSWGTYLVVSGVYVPYWMLVTACSVVA